MKQITVYIVQGSEDGLIGIFRTKKSAIEKAKSYCEVTATGKATCEWHQSKKSKYFLAEYKAPGTGTTSGIQEWLTQ